MHGSLEALDPAFEAVREQAEVARQRYEDHDPYTHGHSVRVASWALRIARHIPGFDPVRLHRLEITALLHDFGKTYLDPELIRKPGKLTEDEWAQMRRHPDLGADHIPVAREWVVEEGIRWHHKGYDGSGYPAGPVLGHDLPLEARLIAVADVFDALTSRRTYREGEGRWAPDRALEMMRGMAGRTLDPALVSLFDAQYFVECARVGDRVGPETLQVQTAIGLEVDRARDLLRAEIGPFDPDRPLRGHSVDSGVLHRLVAGLVRASLDPASAANIARYVLRMAQPETFPPASFRSPPRPVPAPPGVLTHHAEVVLDLREVPPEVSYARVVVFEGRLWLSVGERRGDRVEVRLVR